jgi:Flp pilus assembly CpaE family ATPase
MPVNGISRAAVRQLFILLRRVYSMVVVDLGHALSEENVEGMRQSNFVGLVVRPDVPSLRRVRWALAALAGMGVQRERFEVVLNCYGGRQQIKRAKVEEVLEMRVFRDIPENAAAVTLARNRGVPLSQVSRMAAVSSSFVALARDVQAYARGVTV